MGRAFSSMPSYRSSGILALVVPQVRHFYCLSIGFCPYFAPSHQVSPRGLFVAKHALKYIHLVHTCLLACFCVSEWFRWTLVVSLPDFLCCLIQRFRPMHALLLWFSHMYLSSLSSRWNTCTSLQFLPYELMFVVHLCVSAHIRFFQLCIVSSILALLAQANARISSSHTHARTRKRSPTRLCTFLLSGTFAALVYICRYIPDMPLAFSAAKQLCIPGAAHRAGKSVCQRSRVRHHNSPRSQRAAGLKWVVFNFFLHYGSLINYRSQ